MFWNHIGRNLFERHETRRAQILDVVALMSLYIFALSFMVYTWCVKTTTLNPSVLDTVTRTNTPSNKNGNPTYEFKASNTLLMPRVHFNESDNIKTNAGKTINTIHLNIET